MLLRSPAGGEKSTGAAVLLGDEAVAQAAIDAGASAAYAYPGTPSTEILEYLLRCPDQITAQWCANEKTAYEAALGVSMAGRRALVAMKHVGLNVAADPFINSAIVDVRGGLVVAVADDPSMHSSQNEQDSRYLADFARIPFLEPANQQEAYDMTREAFDVSERFHVPVLLRLVTRLAHSRAAVELREQRGPNPVDKPEDPRSWTLLPAFARRQWHDLLDRQPEMRKWSESSCWNRLSLDQAAPGPCVITTGIARNYYYESLLDLGYLPSHLHVGAYPFPVEAIRALTEDAQSVLVLEEGYPFLERLLRGVLPARLRILGKESGEVPLDGELDPDSVRRALGLAARRGVPVDHAPVASRPPQLCQGCPHGSVYEALNDALRDYAEPLVAADIGCYTLGALPPYSAIESCVCMGASIGMARGAAEAGIHPAVAVLGDSTFLHSGVTPLMDAVAYDADITVLVLDNQTVAMTGSQPTILPSERLGALVQGLGLDPEHLHVLQAKPSTMDEVRDLLRREMDHRGLSVIIAGRECLELAKLRKRAEKRAREEASRS